MDKIHLLLSRHLWQTAPARERRSRCPLATLLARPLKLGDGVFSSMLDSSLYYYSLYLELQDLSYDADFGRALFVKRCSLNVQLSYCRQV